MGGLSGGPRWVLTVLGDNVSGEQLPTVNASSCFDRELFVSAGGIRQ